MCMCMYLFVILFHNDLEKSEWRLKFKRHPRDVHVSRLCEVVMFVIYRARLVQILFIDFFFCSFLSNKKKEKSNGEGATTT